MQISTISALTESMSNGICHFLAAMQFIRYHFYPKNSLFEFSIWNNTYDIREFVRIESLFKTFQQIRSCGEMK